MNNEMRLSDFHFHDAKIVNMYLKGNILKISFANVLNMKDNSNVSEMDIEFVNITITKIERDYGNGLYTTQDTPKLVDFISLLELKPYIYEFIKLESKTNNYYEIFLDRSHGDYLPMVYLTFDSYRLEYLEIV